MKPAQAFEAPTARSVAARALGLATTALDAGEKALRAKLAVEHAVDDGTRTALHLVRQGRYAAEDFADLAKHRVRRAPLQAIAVFFTGGMVIGGCLAYTAGRMRRWVCDD
jgi:hypothetical protein